MPACPYCFATDGHHVQCPKFGSAGPQGSLPVVYESAPYATIDREAATALRLPLLNQVATRPAADRREWLFGLARGLADGLGPDADKNGDAYRLGQRIALLLIEEGHA